MPVQLLGLVVSSDKHMQLYSLDLQSKSTDPSNNSMEIAPM